MYERKSHPPLSRAQFARRMVLHGVVVFALLLGSLALGIAGYVGFEHLTLTDAFLNAAMLLGGMGPVDMPHTQAGKLFAGLYALYAGIVFLVAAALLFTPVLHRLLHRFHWQAGQ